MTDSANSQFDQQHRDQRTTILKVYNYYRIGISFLFLFLFVDQDFGGFVGAENPEIFSITILTYLVINILIAAITMFIDVEQLSRTAPSFAILIMDIICLTLLMSASGGVTSGIGNFLTFTVAFGGGLIYGRVSTVLPAIAAFLTIYVELLFFLETYELASFFQAGVLGMVYFVVNILFQNLTLQLRRREMEVSSLGQINQAVIDEMRTGVVVVTDEGKIQLINGSAEKMLSQQDNEAGITALPSPLMIRLREWRDDPHLMSLTFHSHDTGPQLLASFSGLKDPNSEILIFLEDSTDVQRQAQQLKLAALGRLSASIAHEIRNPLGAISHAAQLLGESEELDAADKRLSEIIQTHCVRMNDVIENVLQMSRRRNAEPVILLVDEWLSDFRAQFLASVGDDAEVVLEVESTQIRIEVDPLHLSQALTNLCQNAIRYSEKKTGRKHVLIRAGVDQAFDGAFIEVIDEGAGVDDEQEKNLFEPFFTTEVTGTGLGLYLSRELCEANSARLSYTKARTGGSCFRIAFYQQSRT